MSTSIATSIMSPGSLYDLLFETILQLPRCTGNATWGCISGAFAQDFIYALFLPHIVLLIFLYIATKGIGNRGLEALLGIGVYVFLIYSGWYAIFANLTLLWLVISIFMAGFYFFWGRILHPTRSKQLFKLGHDTVKKSRTKRKKEAELIKDIHYLEDKLQEARARHRENEVKSISEALTKRELELRELRRG